MERPSVLHLIAQAVEEQWEELDLSGMNLTELPPEIATLTNLTTLYLSDNNLTALPEAIATLTNLTTLNLSGNRLTALDRKSNV